MVGFVSAFLTKIILLRTVTVYFLRNVQILCEGGANFTLTDVEGNSPLDLADKNGQTKTAKYLNNMKKQKARGGNPSVSNFFTTVSTYTFAQIIMCRILASKSNIPVCAYLVSMVAIAQGNSQE